ncbi:MAG: CRISPR system precrRNA processing endoribonuclease RAMP protein Cas6 [Anaerolineales bacterium]
MLTTLHLRFDCEALTSLNLGGWRAGSNLRGALGSVMRRAVCPETSRRRKPDPEHAAVCPACWLLSAEVEPGDVRRAYALTPPLDGAAEYAPGARFNFALSLFGTGEQYLPYFVLAVAEIGRRGVGPGRGQFALRRIDAANPLTGERQTVLAPGEQFVNVPTVRVCAADVFRAAEQALQELDGRGRLGVQFLTPLRLISQGQLVKLPDFGVLAGRLIDRIEGLHRQFGGDWPEVDIPALRSQADGVRHISWEGEWIDTFSGSSRTGNRTPVGGLVGRAVYQSTEWPALLPWLLWGQAVQVGKDVVKGNGLYQVETPGMQPYWAWIAIDGEQLSGNSGV